MKDLIGTSIIMKLSFYAKIVMKLYISGGQMPLNFVPNQTRAQGSQVRTSLLVIERLHEQ